MVGSRNVYRWHHNAESVPFSVQIKWYYYLILGIIDVEANYIGMYLTQIKALFQFLLVPLMFLFACAVVKSYQYTSLTSVMLLDCWSIPCVIVLTWVFLKTKYGLRKFLGVGVCVVGLILVVFSDVHASDRASKNMLLMVLYMCLCFSRI